MNDVAFGYTNLFTTNLPAAVPRFAGFPKFNFIGGHICIDFDADCWIDQH